MEKDYKQLEKIVVNIGTGRLSSQPNFDKALADLTQAVSLITGQKPAACLSKKSIAGFKLRMGTVVGLKTTLRGKRMKDFLDKMVNIALPRIRDFRGLDPKSIDAAGNLTIGFKDQLAFPEIVIDTAKINFGFEVTLVTKAKDREKAVELYKSLGIPFKK